VAGLETMIEHNIVGNLTVLGANVTSGAPAVSERLTTTAAMFTARGMDAVAGRAAVSLLDRVVIDQSVVIAFDTAFNAVALLFVFAAPVLVSIKIVLQRYMHAAQHPHIEEPQIAGFANSDDGDRTAQYLDTYQIPFITTEKYHEDAFALADRSRLLDRPDLDRAGTVSV